MKYREAVIALFAIGLTLFSITGIAASGTDMSGAMAHAQSVGFDALAHHMFGDNACTAADAALLPARADLPQ